MSNWALASTKRFALGSGQQFFTPKDTILEDLGSYGVWDTMSIKSGTLAMCVLLDAYKLTLFRHRIGSAQILLPIVIPSTERLRVRLKDDKELRDAVFMYCLEEIVDAASIAETIIDMYAIYNPIYVINQQNRRDVRQATGMIFVQDTEINQS